VIPYIDIPPYHLFGLIPIQPFGVLVGIALVVGYSLGRRRARLTGLDPQICADGMVWIVVSGFIVAHLVSVIFYFPHRILDNPLVLLAVWSGLSSFGGYVGGALGAYLYFRRKGVSIIKYVDAITFGMVPAWILGRLGCTVVHDHPGRETAFFLGVKYKDGIIRHDLGLYEMLLAVVLTIIIYSLKKVRPFDGFYPALMLLIYSPVRFVLDYLRVGDKTYLGLTPGQYFSIVMMGVAVWLIVRGIRRRGQAVDPKTSSARAR
jgi:phosphatidylglycerol---prolipoprotein diacylglyceryl transferase